VRHRAKLVAWRSALKASVHAVLAKQGLRLGVSDLFGVGGRELLAKAPLDGAYRLRVNALLRLIDAMDFEISPQRDAVPFAGGCVRLWARSGPPTSPPPDVS